MKYIDKNGNVYEGDLRIGDRIASADEILNFENSKNQKFQENTDYEIIDK